MDKVIDFNETVYELCSKKKDTQRVSEYTLHCGKREKEGFL